MIASTNFLSHFIMTMNQQIIVEIIDEPLDSYSERPPVVPAPMAPLAEAAHPALQKQPVAIPDARPMCWSNQHPSLNVGIARRVAGAAGGSGSSSGGMGAGGNSVVPARRGRTEVADTLLRRGATIEAVITAHGNIDRRHHHLAWTSALLLPSDVVRLASCPSMHSG